MTKKIISITQKGIAVAELLISQERDLNMAFADWLEWWINKQPFPFIAPDLENIRAKIKQLRSEGKGKC